jgi:hypothetical protein
VRVCVRAWVRACMHAPGWGLGGAGAGVGVGAGVGAGGGGGGGLLRFTPPPSGGSLPSKVGVCAFQGADKHSSRDGCLADNGVGKKEHGAVCIFLVSTL